MRRLPTRASAAASLEAAAAAACPALTFLAAELPATLPSRLHLAVGAVDGAPVRPPPACKPPQLAPRLPLSRCKRKCGLLFSLKTQLVVARVHMC